MTTKLYVGNLPFSSTESGIEELFSNVGKVEEVALIKDRTTGKSRGFAFVTLSTQEEAEKGIEIFDGKDFEGRKLVVNMARPRE